MSLHPAQSLEVRLCPAAMMWLVTILLVLMLGVLAMLAAHHAQTVQNAQGGTSSAVLAELATAAQPLAGSDGSAEIAGEHLAVGLATGCIVLIACCALGLALLSARAWRADLFRRLSSVAQTLRAVIGAPPTALTSTARPSLVVLSISRT